MRDLLDELARVRRNKVQAGLRELAGALSVVKLTNLACMEVNTIRPFFQAALDRFFRLRAVRARPGSPAGGAGTPRPPHAWGRRRARALFLSFTRAFPFLPCPADPARARAPRARPGQPACAAHACHHALHLAASTSRAVRQAPRAVHGGRSG